MRAVTWTQVAQYVIIIIAYLVPVVILSSKITSVPVPQASYGIALKQIGEKELELFSDPREISARTQYGFRAEEYARKIADLPVSFDAERKALVEELNALRQRCLGA